MIDCAKFDLWWREDGRFIDPDTSDVPWFDKREALSAMAFAAGMKAAEKASSTLGPPSKEWCMNMAAHEAADGGNDVGCEFFRGDMRGQHLAEHVLAQGEFLLELLNRGKLLLGSFSHVGSPLFFYSCATAAFHYCKSYKRVGRSRLSF